MIEIIEKVEKELETLGLKRDDVENDNIIEACVAKVALVDNLKKEGMDFDELERKLYPDSSFLNQMILHLDEGGSGEDIITEFLVGAFYHSQESENL